VPEAQPATKGAWKVGRKLALTGFCQYSSLYIDEMLWTEKLKSMAV
jgi:hypothetical protein